MPNKITSVPHPLPEVSTDRDGWFLGPLLNCLKLLFSLPGENRKVPEAARFVAIDPRLTCALIHII